MLDKVKIDLRRLAFDKRKTYKEIADECGFVYATLLNIKHRGTIDIRMVKKLEAVYPDAAKYLN